MRRNRAGMLVLTLLAVFVLATAANADPYSDYLTARGEASCMAYGDSLVMYLPWLGLSNADRTYLADTFAALPFDSPEWLAWQANFDAAVR